jgi:hypothetical protein
VAANVGLVGVLAVADLDELDKPVELVREDDGVRLRYAAAFEKMTPMQRADWPNRSYRRWRRRRIPLLLIPIVVGVLVGLWDQSWSVGIGAVGLGLDILGAWMLSEGVLVRDDEADSYATYGAWGQSAYLAKRDSRQARFGLLVLVVGFVGQFLSLVIAAWPR